MAATLKWDGDRLLNGEGREMAKLCEGRKDPRPFYEVDLLACGKAQAVLISPRYEDKNDARQDAESEVRRLLKEARVKVEP